MVTVKHIIKMKQSYLKLTFSILLTSVGFLTFAQDSKIASHTVQIVIPEVALLDLETSGSSSITVTAVSPTEAGNPLDFTTATNSNLWINYSSIVGSSSDPSRTVSANITTGTIPGGVDLKVVAASDAGQGSGTVGTTASALTLSSSAQTLISGIGSAYTGNGTSKGHNLTYTLAAKSGDYANIDFDDSPASVTVTYTLSDN